MSIADPETEDLFGDYLKITDTLSNGDPWHTQRNCLERCCSNDKVTFNASVLNNSVFSLSINGEVSYIPWECLWGLYARFNERTGTITSWHHCVLSLRGKEPVSFDTIEPEDFIGIVKDKVFAVSVSFSGYRLNYGNPAVDRCISDEANFKKVEFLLRRENFIKAKGLTVKGLCLDLREQLSIRYYAL